MHMDPLNSHWNVIAVFIIVGLIQCILLLSLFLNKRPLKKHRFFLFFLGVLFILQLEAFLIRSAYLVDLLALMNTSTPFVFLLGPLLLFYVRDLTISPKLKLQDGLHAFPFLFYFAYSFNFFLQPAAYKYNAFLRSFHPAESLQPVSQLFSSDPWNIQGWVVVELLALHLFIYAAISFFHILKTARNSSLDKSLKQWMLYLNGLFLLGGLLLFLSQGGIVNGQRLFSNILPSFIPDIWGTIAAYLITLYLGWNANLFKSTQPKYQKSKLPKPLLHQRSQSLRMLIEKEKLYLNPDFSLSMLAQRSGLSKHHISQILNEDWRCNFFELAHDYRIKEAKRILQDAEDYIKVEQLAYDLGYKSKTTFFNAFKKATNLTPAKFRNQIVLQR